VPRETPGRVSEWGERASLRSVGRKTAIGCAVAVLVLAASSSAAATKPLTGYLTGCSAYGDLEICSGEVPSFDGSTLDVDLTKPLTRAAHHPLIVMLHGFANDKHEWESVNDTGDGADTWHWNSHWFAEHGYYVLNYTARGFRTDAADKPYEPDTPAGSSIDLPSGTIHLKSREFEIRDTQWLAALVADAYPDVDPSQVAVTGGSYGGGESWLQASQAEWTFPHRWSWGELPVLQLQVAVPKYGWTDLGYSLAPDGHPGPGGGVYDSALGRPDLPDCVPCTAALCNPIGTVKLSYVKGFYTLGLRDGYFMADSTSTAYVDISCNEH